MNEDKTGEEGPLELEMPKVRQDQGSYFRTGEKASSDIGVVKCNWAGRWSWGYVQRGKKQNMELSFQMENLGRGKD